MGLFKEIQKQRHFSSWKMVLILTKADLLVERLERFKSEVDFSFIEVVEVRKELKCVRKDAQLILESVISQFEQSVNHPLEFHIINTTNREEVIYLANLAETTSHNPPFISPSLHNDLFHTNLRKCDLFSDVKIMLEV